MTDQAIAWVRATRSLTPDRPFLMYYSSSAGHPPHTPPKAWLEKGLYQGEFDQGWDVMREEILATPEGDGHRRARHQAGRESGLHPALGHACPRTRRRSTPGRWRSTPPWWRAPTTRSAGWSTRSRSSASSTTRCSSTSPATTAAPRSATSTASSSSGVRSTARPEDIPYLLSRLDEYGGPTSYPNYSVGWAWAGATPATWCIQMAHARRQHGRHGRALAQGHQGQGREAPPVRQRHRRRPDHPGGRRHPRAEDRQRRTSRPRWPGSAWPTPSTTPTRRPARHPVQRGVRATAASTTTAGWPRSSTARRGSRRRAVERLRPGSLGALPHGRGLRPRHRPRRRSTPTSSRR